MSQNFERLKLFSKIVIQVFVTGARDLCVSADAGGRDGLAAATGAPLAADARTTGLRAAPRRRPPAGSHNPLQVGPTSSATHFTAAYWVGLNVI